MKCSHCGSEWKANMSYSQISNCPFCGQSLISKPKPGENASAGSIVKQIVEQFGADILLQKNRFLSVFVDYAPKMRKEKKMLSIALDENIATLFVNCETSDRELHVKKAQRALDMILAESAIHFVVETFAYAFDWDIEIEAPVSEDSSPMKESVKSPDDYKESLRFPPINENSFRKAVKKQLMTQNFYVQRFLSELNDGNYQYAYGELNKEHYWVSTGIFRMLLSPGKSRKYADGNSMAGVQLAQMYFWGNGVSRSKKKFIKILASLLESGNPLVLAWISEAYRCSIPGVIPQDKQFSSVIYRSCQQHLKKLADSGMPDAQYFLGFNLLCGIDCDKDEKAGFEYIKRAASSGMVNAIVTFAKCYSDGKGCKRDVSQALSILKPLSHFENANYHYLLGLIFYLNKYKEYVAQDDKVAFRHFMMAAKQGHAAAQDYLGDCYYYGYGVTKDNSKARSWYEAAFRQNNTHAASQLGEIYHRGYGVPEDEEKAYSYYKFAADKGNSYSQYMLSYYLFDMNGRHRNYELGRQYLEKAAQSGHLDSQKFLARTYISDFGYSDDSKFIYWMQKAADQGDAEAERMLGGYYLKEGGKNQAALRLLNQASEHGDVLAKLYLAELYSPGKAVLYSTGKKVDYSNVIKVVDLSSDVVAHLGEFDNEPEKKNNIKARIKKVLTDTRNVLCLVLKECSMFSFYYPWDSKFSKKLQEARKKYAYATLNNTESVLCLMCWTIFNSGKEGYVLTDENFYANFSGDKIKIPIWSIDSISPESKDKVEINYSFNNDDIKSYKIYGVSEGKEQIYSKALTDIVHSVKLMEFLDLDEEKENDVSSSPMAPLYGCPTAKEVPGIVPDCMLTEFEGYTWEKL